MKNRFKYTPKVGALDANGDMHFEYEITWDEIKIFATKYNLQTSRYDRVPEPIHIIDNRQSKYRKH